MNPNFDNERKPLGNVLLSIVMPVYNERDVLEQLIRRVSESAARCGCRYEIIMVNDGSHDGSGELLDRIAARVPQLKVVHFSRNFGHQSAVQAGLVHAQGDAIVLMDSDLQDAPEAITRFFAKWQDGYDVVFAVRTKRKENLFKRILFAGFHRFLSGVATTDIPTDAGIFGLVDVRVKNEIVALAERDRYLPGLRSWVGFRQKGIVVERLARYDGQPRVSILGLWRLAKTAVFGFSNFPLLVFNMIGFAALFVFVALSGYALFCKLFTDLTIPGWTSHVLSASFFGALNAMGISILGEYVTRIYDQVRQRPMYVVARTVNVAAGQATDFAVESHTMFEQLPQFPADYERTEEELLEEAAALPEAPAADAPLPLMPPLGEENSGFGTSVTPTLFTPADSPE